MKKEFYIPSSDQKSRLHTVMWRPRCEPRAIIQISHGMMEYVNRYDDFARAAEAEGFLVIGHDHLGHGNTAETRADLGYFASGDGTSIVIKDMIRVTKFIKKRYPNIPCFLLSHSMGSFFARTYITIYGRNLDGLILIGTGNQPLAKVAAAELFAAVLIKAKGEFHRSKLLHDLVFGGYNKKFSSKRTGFDWLTRDEKEMDKYLKDPLCCFRFTVSAYHDLFVIFKELGMKKGFDQIPRKLPILITSGSEDPVGGFSKGINQVYRQFLKIGIQDLQVKLYEEGRHEILNETNKDEVYQDLFDWIAARI